MEHLKRYLKLFISKEKYSDIDVAIKMLLAALLGAGVFAILTFTEIGRNVLYIIALALAFILFLGFLSLLLIVLVFFFKDYFQKKRQWMKEPENEEEQKDCVIVADYQGSEQVITNQEKEEAVENIDKEDELEQIVNSGDGEPSAYFFDLTAFDYYGGIISQCMVTDSFSPKTIVGEENAVLVTDTEILRQLERLEKDPKNKLYRGFSHYIESHFEIVCHQLTFPYSLDYVVSARGNAVIFVTKDEKNARTARKTGVKVKWFGDEKNS